MAVWNEMDSNISSIRILVMVMLPHHLIISKPDIERWFLGSSGVGESEKDQNNENDILGHWQYIISEHEDLL